MVAGCLCDFCEILACWRWVWWGFCRNWLKLRVTVQLVMQKARVVEPKTQCRFVDSHESSVGLKCCKFFGLTLVASSWAREVFPSTPSTSPSTPTLELEVYEFYSNLLIVFNIFTMIFTIITVFNHNHTHLMSSSVTANWNGGHG